MPQSCAPRLNPAPPARGAGARPRFYALTLLFALATHPTRAQAPTAPPSRPPDAPAAAPLPQQPQPAATATLSGSVADIHGAVLPGAELTLTGDAQRTTVSDTTGHFTFTNLPSGAFRLAVASPGLQPYTSPEILLTPGEIRDLSPIGLPIATRNTVVQVFSGTEPIAVTQVHLAEQQRVLGIIPNFYSSYIWDAAPLTPKLKFDLAYHSTRDPLTFLITAGVAGIEHAHNSFPGYGAGPEGYAKRYGASYADAVVARFVGSAILPTVFRQDPRYFYKGKGSIPSRALYAIGAAVIARGDNGRAQPNYSHVLGNFAAAGISNLYRASEDRSASLSVRNGLILTGTNAFANLIREFLLRDLTSKVPAFEQGKP